jgi:2,3-bisphosphoglycerate-dependent phosphoglycerate mutase
VTDNPATDAAVPRPKLASPLDQAFLTNEPGITELVIVRHGQQDIDYANVPRVQDMIDPPLSAVGRRQAELVGERFRNQPVDIVYASPLLRALHTGEAIAGHHGLKSILDDDLREIETWRGLPRDKSVTETIGRDRLGGLRSRMLRELSWDVYPYSERSVEFRSRVVTAIESIAAMNEGKRVVIACHGGVINAYVGYVLGLNADMWFRPSHTAVNVVRVGSHGRRAVCSIGDIHHLEQADRSLITH